ncbi:MAG: branched-chain amino acid ABC transporter permease, partial [Frankia sp.]|nr:branched-chain amino acid ABC transporter permease [Frankia sp.]
MTVTSPAERMPGARADRAARPVSYRRHQFPQIAVFLVAVAVAVKLGVDSRSTMNNVNLWLIYSVSAIGFYWIFGVAGRFAFSHTFMMALGAYTSAFVSRHGWSPWIGLLCAAVATVIVATAVGAAVHRAHEFYFAIATIAVMEVGRIVFLRAESFTGPNGTAFNVESLSLFGVSLLEDADIFWFLLAVLGLMLVLAVLIDRSPLARRLVAARDNPQVARTTGVDVFGLQLMMFAIGSCVAGLSGALIGHWSGVVSMDSFGMDLSVGVFLMVVLGGLGSHWGAVVGAAFYVGMPELLSGLTRYQPLIYGSVLLVTIVAMPDGVIGGLNRLVARLRGRPAGPAPANPALAALRRLAP